MAGKKIKVPLPKIPWSENSHAQVWSLIAEISKSVNYKVLYGKKDKNENTFGESKASIYKRIGSIVLPKFSLIDPTATGDRIKNKLET
ncbi:hypothetical protein SCLCIDRAFT_34571 [Scleroderma citrinum Foug A]|uniref:Uncharacterized protein n=1 Tax=Scleroderma citrinum Foug A TaxID=1036808 RepID=A0A0C3D1A0_9AGAM|nr:hypothetical protein SCLCIDRAFT_34571 [Scleroderma citrinum Foug A]